MFVPGRIEGSKETKTRASPIRKRQAAKLVGVPGDESIAVCEYNIRLVYQNLRATLFTNYTQRSCLVEQGKT